MKNRYFNLVALTVLALLFCAHTLAAQEAVSPEKKALIKEILVATDALKNAEAMRTAMSAELERTLLRVLAEAVGNDAKLTEAEREQLRESLSQRARRARQRFEQLLAQKIDYGQLVEEISYEVYDKFFTLEELKDLLAFYRTATGQKTIRVMPQLFAESMTRTNERLTPLIQPLVKEIMEEEMKQRENQAPGSRP